MSPTISIELPRDVLHAARITSDDVKRELAITLFEQGRLSFGKARELAALPIGQFQQLLGSRGICVHYDLDDYRQDLARLAELERE